MSSSIKEILRKTFRSTSFQISILIVLCFLTRWQHLMNPGLILDGDECIEALMGKHLLEGKSFPVYFYGQSYGFALIEVLAIAGAFVTTGVSELSVNLAMLTLWSTGVVFFYLTLNRSDHRYHWPAFFLTLILILAPSWELWAIKARGGYITAFLLTYFIGYLLLNSKWKEQSPRFLFIGILSVILYESQPLWLPGLLPILVYGIMTAYSRKNALGYFLGGTLIAILPFAYLSARASSYWLPHVVTFSLSEVLGNLIELPQRIHQQLSGAYFYWREIPSGLASETWSYLLMTLLAIVLLIFITRFARGERDSLILTLGLSLILTCAYLPFLGEAPRYSLPLTGYGLLFLHGMLLRLSRPVILIIPLGMLFLLGAASFYRPVPKEYGNADREALEKLLDHLGKKGIHHVHCRDGLLQWQIAFYSKERIIPRYKNSNDRYPPYIRCVNEAYEDPNEQTALLGYTKPPFEHLGNDPTLIGSTFFIIEDPPRSTLNKAGFELE